MTISELGKSKYLRDFFGIAGRPDIHESELQSMAESTAVLVIDMQPICCDPKKPHFDEYGRGVGWAGTHQVAERIVDVLPAFRAANLKVIWTYYDFFNYPDVFYLGAPEVGDVVIPKNRDSAFKGSDIHEQLIAMGVERLIVMGFSTSACVISTVNDALEEGYAVSVLKDCVENSSHVKFDMHGRSLEHMGQKGAVIADSEEFLNVLPLRGAKKTGASLQMA